VTIDLRSDTVTQPTAAMLAAMGSATLGDDARDGDATVRELEALAAARTGKEDALFVPSGSMANLVALLAHADRGGEVLLDPDAHIARSELGGVSNLAGMFCRALPAARGAVDLDALADALHGSFGAGHARTAVVCMETTHNAAGGAVLPLAHMQAVHRLARDKGVPVHVDGARLFNAAVALGVPAATIAQHCDSIGFCLSKGLSAPVGSVVCGSRAFIVRARGFRRMLGGHMRQAGPLAAAGIVALTTMIERLAGDHRTAQRLAAGLRALDATLTDPAQVETNIVRVDTGATGRFAPEWSAALATRGIRVGAYGRHTLRFVTHRHVGDAEIDAALAAWTAAR
jgi:threonine aldolase